MCSLKHTEVLLDAGGHMLYWDIYQVKSTVAPSYFKSHTNSCCHFCLILGLKFNLSYIRENFCVLKLKALHPNGLNQELNNID